MRRPTISMGSVWLAAALVLGTVATAAPAQTVTANPTVTPTRLATRTATASVTRTASHTPTASMRPTITATGTRTGTFTRSPTPSQTPSRTVSFTATPSSTLTRTLTRTRTPTETATPRSTATRTDTPTRTRTPTRSITPTASVTALNTATPTALAAFASVELINNRAGDNHDGTLTTVLTALISDSRGNPVGDGIEVMFGLAPPVSGVTVEASGMTGELPSCDVSAYIEETGMPIEPRPGTAYGCLRYVRSRESATVSVVAQLSGAGGLVQGRRQVRLPNVSTPLPTATRSQTRTPTASASSTATETATVTDTPSITNTPTITATPVATATVTQTDTPEETPTDSDTPTVTETATATASATATLTPLEPIRVAAVGGSVRPGTSARIRFDLTDLNEEVYALQFDALIEVPVFDVFQITTQCRPSPTLTTHQLSATRAFDPPPPQGLFRLRFVLFDSLGGVDHLRAGPVIECTLPVADDAPLGPSTITVERVLAGDRDGRLLNGTLTINGTLVVDPDAPLPTSTATVTVTPTATETPTATATRTATATPTARDTATHTPTASVTRTATALPTATETATATPSATASPSASPTVTPLPCIGDCNGDGRVVVNELIVAVRIGSDRTPIDQCRAADRNRNDVITIDELIAAVGNAARGCPSSMPPLTP